MRGMEGIILVLDLTLDPTLMALRSPPEEEAAGVDPAVETVRLPGPAAPDLPDHQALLHPVSCQTKSHGTSLLQSSPKPDPLWPASSCLFW